MLISSLSTTSSSYYSVFFYGDLEQILYLNSFRYGEDQSFFPSFLFLKNNQHKIIHMPKRHFRMAFFAPLCSLWGILSGFTLNYLLSLLMGQRDIFSHHHQKSFYSVLEIFIFWSLCTVFPLYQHHREFNYQRIIPFWGFLKKNILR